MLATKIAHMVSGITMITDIMMTVTGTMDRMSMAIGTIMSIAHSHRRRPRLQQRQRDGLSPLAIGAMSLL